jgi:hypothetical protein
MLPEEYRGEPLAAADRRDMMTAFPTLPGTTTGGDSDE